MAKGFKVFNPDWTCLTQQYEVGKTYEMNCSPICCNLGFHFCGIAADCFGYYSFNPENHVAEVVAHGEVVTDGDKSCTNKIEIAREIPWEELLTIVNSGTGNTGLGNTGDWNTGGWNTGHQNTGHWNTGHQNTGHQNTGDWNTGHQNTGDWNTGHRNTGDWNTGHRNTGDWNFSDRCTGDFNLADHQTGCFCTEETKIKFFDADTDMTFSQWRSSDAYSILCRIPFIPTKWIYSCDMTAKEKKAHPEHVTTGGYLKTNDLTKVFGDWWKSLYDREKKIIREIPNFDTKKFEQITGINVEA